MEDKEITPDTIWSVRQNIPELVVMDCVQEFGLTDEQADKLRFILLKRGVNKWFYARRKFIDLKHRVKDYLREEVSLYEALKGQGFVDRRGQTYAQRDFIKFLNNLNAEMQKIARLPRWIEFPKTVTHNWDKIESQVIIKGRHV